MHDIFASCTTPHTPYTTTITTELNVFGEIYNLFSKSNSNLQNVCTFCVYMLYTHMHMCLLLYYIQFVICSDAHQTRNIKTRLIITSMVRHCELDDVVYYVLEVARSTPTDTNSHTAKIIPEHQIKFT